MLSSARLQLLHRLSWCRSLVYGLWFSTANTTLSTPTCDHCYWLHVIRAVYETSKVLAIFLISLVWKYYVGVFNNMYCEISRSFVDTSTCHLSINVCTIICPSPSPPHWYSLPRPSPLQPLLWCRCVVTFNSPLRPALYSCNGIYTQTSTILIVELLLLL